MNSNLKTYEAMFLVDSGQPSFEVASEPIRSILTRREAEILAMKPWDDRRLTYSIRGRKRALYVLAYFRAATSQLAEMEHDCQLDERILRSLFLRQERLTPEQIAAETPATAAGHKTPHAREGGEERAERPAEQPAGPASAGEGPGAEPAQADQGAAALDAAHGPSPDASSAS